MLRITKQADYGIILMTCLADEPDRLSAAVDLAAEAHVPPPMASKVLRQLASSGLLDSQRGVKGGYRLARPPADISVAEIIGALEGPIALTECIALGPGECDQEPMCPTRGKWHLINNAVQTALEAISLADMAAPGAPGVDGGSDMRLPIELHVSDAVHGARATPEALTRFQSDAPHSANAIHERKPVREGGAAHEPDAVHGAR